VNEFDLIREILDVLGAATGGGAVRVGPGDDAAVIAAPEGADLVSSMDAVVGDVHFPASAGASLIGYRSLMVSLSDLAAMGAEPGFALVALTLPEMDAEWTRQLASGMARAAQEASAPVVGGNIARGPLTITVSVHGWLPAGSAITRGGARPGHGVYVTGELGGAAAALTRGGLGERRVEADLDALDARYFLPAPRLEAGKRLRGLASSAIDVSDGLLQDLGHLCRASGTGAELDGASIPVMAGAKLEHALFGGDDYELCFTAAAEPGELGVACTRIGTVVAGSEITLDARPVSAAGYQHFR
jgi:thiamine-monophosphate kinase